MRQAHLYNNQVVRAAFTVFAFWWVVLTLASAGWSPMQSIQNFSFVPNRLFLWTVGLITGFCLTAWVIWWRRIRVMNQMVKTNCNGIVSLMGDVPMLAKPPKRTSRPLPISSEIINAWLGEAEKKHPAHHKMFLAVWNVLSAHANLPATHRAGGHGATRLWRHSLNVTENALKHASEYDYQGVYLKPKGRPKTLILPKRDENYTFDAADPLIPIIALAHDIGKIEAIITNPDGSFSSKESANNSHDDRLIHDYVGAQILARMPEYWGLNARDRRAINLVIGHYHHPSEFPVTKEQLSIEDRMTALMEFLILVDRKTGNEEAGRLDIPEEEEVSEEESEGIYRAFVEVVTEFGRINGIGKSDTDKTFKIGQKHDGLIIVQERALRTLMYQKLSKSEDSSPERRYRMTLNLLETLTRKGLLYNVHQGINFARYYPMYVVAFYNSKRAASIAHWMPALVFKPDHTIEPAFSSLVGLPSFGSRANFVRQIYTHQPHISDPEKLRELHLLAFKEEATAQLKLNMKPGTKEEDDTEEGTPAPAASAATTSASAVGQSITPAAPSLLVAPATPTPVPVVAQAAPDPTTPVADEPAKSTLGAEHGFGLDGLDDDFTIAAPAIPDVPEDIQGSVAVPDVPSVPDIPDVLSIPDIPEAPSMPDIPDVPDVPDLPDEPTANDLNELEMPSIPEVPAIPEELSAPDIPEVPKIPAVTTEPETGNADPVGGGQTISDPDLQNPKVKKDDQDKKLNELAAALTAGTGGMAGWKVEKNGKKPPKTAPANPQAPAAPKAETIASQPAAQPAPAPADHMLTGFLTMAKKYIAQQKVPICGSLGGLDYVLISDLQTAMPRMDVEGIITNGKLKVMGEGQGRMVGIPK